MPNIKSHKRYDKVDPRFLKTEGIEAFSGCELIVKGLLETDGGTHLWTGYPGSPIAAIFDTMEMVSGLVKERGIRVSVSNNEAVSAAMANGSQMLALRTMVAMKSVGVHVASDALSLGNLAGVHPDGGVIVVIGDDPWSESTQVPADSRFIARHMHMPVMEPSDPQQLKDWVNLAYKLSRASGFYIGYLVTTNQADGGGTVSLKSNHYPEINANAKVDLITDQIPLERMVLLPPRTGKKEIELEQRRKKLWDCAKEFEINKICYADSGSPIGFISSGMCFCYLEHALEEMGLTGKFPILKLGLTYPVDPQIIETYAKLVETFIVVEERRDFIEEQITSILNRFRIKGPAAGLSRFPQVYGKVFPDPLKGIPDTLGLNPSILIERLAPFLLEHAKLRDPFPLQRELQTIKNTEQFNLELSTRIPGFCPGCPHRDSSSVLKSIKQDFRSPHYMKKMHGRGPVDLVFHGDTGCYTMLMFEPNKELMHNYSGMGLGGATGAGIDPFIVNKQAVFMGDSTFFHSGLIAISNAIKSNQDIAYIILDNQTTAMTGHQPTPGIQTDIVGDKTYRQNIEKMIAAMADFDNLTVTRVNPAERDSYRQLIEKTLLQEGVKVVIADKECGIIHHRRELKEQRITARKLGYLPLKKHIHISEEVCENCLECTNATGCPGLTFKDTSYGKKIQTDGSWCVSDGACSKIHVCPSFEEILVQRKRPMASPLSGLDLEHIPDVTDKVPLGESWHCYLTGVGGMGIGVATAILARAGVHEGYRILFCDKKGLAIRNGGVYSQMTYVQNGKHCSNVIPYGKADLIIGVDILEAARCISANYGHRVASLERTAAVINSAKTPTILSLLGRDDFDPGYLEQMIRQHTKGDRYFSVNVSSLAEHYFGTKLFSNIILLGIAYQCGLIPVKLENVLLAIRHTVGSSVARENFLAFQFGRKIVVDPAAILDPEVGMTYPFFKEYQARLLSRSLFRGKKVAHKYIADLENIEKSTDFDEKMLMDLVKRYYDLIQFEDLRYAKHYLHLVKQIYVKDTTVYHYAATKAVIWNLAKLMLIKDEVYVAHLLTCPEKLERDKRYFNIDAKRGDRISYTHLNKPRFDIGPFKIEFKLNTKNWQLKIMRRMKILRRLLPQWHRKEKEFRDWYVNLLASFDYSSEKEYEIWVKILQSPEKVTGFREIRYPKQEKVIQEVSLYLDQLKDISPSSTIASLSVSKMAAV